jgi:hypothetical protein
MRNLAMMVAGMLAVTGPVQAESVQLSTNVLAPEAIETYCAQASGVTLLGRTQLKAGGDTIWRALAARDAPVVEKFELGATAPLLPGRCYVIARVAGNLDGQDHIQRTAFEVYDFARDRDSGAVKVMVIGRRILLP